MRKINFKRDRKFNSAIMPVFIFMDEENIGLIKNGKEFEYLIDEEVHSFHVVWTISTDPKNTYRQSVPLIIEKSNNDIKVRVKNSYSMRTGSKFELEYFGE